MSPLTEPTTLVLAKGQPVPVDLDYSNVSLLLHGNGANNSTTITDSSPTPKTVTAVGNAKISTAIADPFGNSTKGVIAFDGNGDYLSIAASNDWNIAGNYTIEFWAKMPSQSTSSYTLGYFGTQAIGGSSGFALGHYLGNLTLRLNGSSTTSSSAPLLVNTWQHIALVSNGVTVKGYIGGNEVFSTNFAATATSTPLIIGNYVDLDVNRYFTGYIDEFRITKGVARYTSNFTPPTAPFPDF